MLYRTDSPSIKRALSLLETLLDQPQGAGIHELLARVDVSRSSLFVLLNTLKILGYIEQTEKRGRYRAGPRLLAWQGSASSLPTADVVSAFFHETESSDFEETLALLVPVSDGEALVFGNIEGRREVRCGFEAGQRLPASSAAGQVFRSPVSAEIRSRGYCQMQRGDALDIAFPICRDGVTPIAALLMSLPAFRWDEVVAASALPGLREMAARLSYRLGAPIYSPWHVDAQVEIGETAPLNKNQLSALLKAPWTAHLACVRPDGTSHVVPVWHEWDGKAFHVLAWKGSHWGEYLITNPQVSLTVDEPWLPLRRISAKGVAHPEFESTDPQLGKLLARLSRRYLGQNLAASLAPQVERSFVITPSALRGWQGIA